MATLEEPSSKNQQVHNSKCKQCTTTKKQVHNNAQQQVHTMHINKCRQCQQQGVNLIFDN